MTEDAADKATLWDRARMTEHLRKPPGGIKYSSKDVGGVRCKLPGFCCIVGQTASSCSNRG